MIQELKLGDVIIFQADKKWISKLIAWGTYSDVSHAAMVYAADQIIEMGLDGIMVNQVETGAGETVYQLRLSPELDISPVMAAAQRYLDAHICYDVPALVLLGIVLIYRHIRPNEKAYILLDSLLTIACVEADKLIKNLQGHPDAMVCSQLVYQVYLDCGGDYQLRVKNGVFEKQTEQAFQTAKGGLCLADLAQEAPALKTAVDAVNSNDIEETCRQLLEALQQGEAEDSAALMPPANVLSKTGGLIERLHKIAQMLNLPMDALLVMPADLAYHTENLQRIAQFEVDRVKRLQ